MEKKKSIDFKKIVVSILSILFVVCAYVPCIPKVRADQLTYGIYTYQYGKMSYVTEPFASANNTRWNYKTTLAFENNLYTSIDVAVTVNPLTQYTAILCENCNLTYINVSSNLIVIRMRSAMTAKVEIYSPSNPLIVDAWNYGNPVTTYTDGNFDYDANMNTYIVRTEQHVETIEQYVGAVNRSVIALHNSLGYSSSNTLASTLNTIKTEIVASGVTTRAMLTQLNKLSDIDLKLQSINTNINGLNLSNIDIKNNLESYFTDQPNVDNIYSWVVDIDDKITQILTTLNNINSAVNNIDRQIDAISWITLNNALSYSTSIDGTYGMSNITSNNETLYIKVSPISYRQNALYKIKTGIYNSNNSSARPTNVTCKVWYYNGSTFSDRSSYQEVIYIDSSSEYLTLYLNTSFYRTGDRSLIIEVNRISTQTGYLRYASSQSNISYIPDTDIEYFELLRYFNQYNMNKQILDAIQSVSVDITQNDITEMNTNITEYNTTMTDINQIENNYINNFNTVDNNIDLTNNSSPSVNLVNARLQFNSVFNDITADLRIRGLLIFVLICGIILILLGA